MALQYRNLTPIVRLLMLEELAHDINATKLYIGLRLTPSGAQDWPVGLRSALEFGTDATLEVWLQQSGRLRTDEDYIKNGVMRLRKVPHTAAQTLAEGEFNRFYIRAVCRQAMNERRGVVTVYRARHSDAPRPESIAIEGKQFVAESLLIDLRNSTSVDGVQTALGLPPGPNSGMSVYL